MPQRTFEDTSVSSLRTAGLSLTDVPGPAPTPVLSAAVVRGVIDDDEEDVPGSLPAADTLEPMSVAGTGGGPISWDARLDETVELCTERKASRGEGGREFKSGAMA